MATLIEDVRVPRWLKPLGLLTFLFFVTAQVIAVVNQQTANLHSVYTTQASISVPLLPAFRSSLALERPRR